MSGNFVGFPIDIDVTLKHLRQDMRDDWFYDAVGYEDLLSNGKSLVSVLNQVLDENHGRYEPGEKSTYDVPKRALGLRYTIELDFYDRFLYQAICTFLIPYFDPLLSNRVFSHRYNKYGDSRYLFKNRIELWKTFENISFLPLIEDRALLITDLLNYFEQISVDVIENAFVGMITKIKASGVEKNTIRSAISTLRELLEKWCYNNRHGLPQNRDASSFIANVVLDSVDQLMLKKGYDYYRYVDDIRISCVDEYEARRALNDLIHELRKLGLNINSKKTAILKRNSPDIKDYFPSSDETMTLIDTMWKSRSKKVITRSIPVLFAFLKKQLDEDATQGRPFRYCVNRFKTLISSNLFDSKSVLAEEIADSLINELAAQPVSTDQFCKLLMDLNLSNGQLQRIADFVANEDIAIHCWQNYHLLLLLAHKKYEHAPLVDYCKALIENRIARAEVSACFIYLASIGKAHELEPYIQCFDGLWPYQHQRHFLIALQSTPKDKLKPIVNKLDFRLRGTIARMKNNNKFKGDVIYLRDFNVTSIDKIYDEISPYE